MLFGSAATVDAVCHLNSWGRCSIPIHALQVLSTHPLHRQRRQHDFLLVLCPSVCVWCSQAGLKNRQLDTVDFYLKSKENVLSSSTAFGAADQPAASSPDLSDGSFFTCLWNTSVNVQLKSDCSSPALIAGSTPTCDPAAAKTFFFVIFLVCVVCVCVRAAVQELCPALDLLCSAIRDSNSEAQSRQFSEQLLNITMTFITTQIRCVLTNAHRETTNTHTHTHACFVPPL